jgi:hypothetical protein
LNASNPSASSPNIGIDRFVREAVHEFHTRLTVIREFASILADGPCEPGVVTSEACVQAILGASGDPLDRIESFRGIATVASAPSRRSCAASTIWEDVRPGLAPRAEERGVRLEAVRAGRAARSRRGEDRVVPGEGTRAGRCVPSLDESVRLAPTEPRRGGSVPT